MGFKPIETFSKGAENNKNASCNLNYPHKYNMNARVLLVLYLCLALVITRKISKEEYDLSPKLPPSGFLGLYYTCQFYVQGLTAPNFSFKNLPSCLDYSASGVIQGTPDTVGSFPFTVIYSYNQVYVEEEIVLRIMEPVNDEKSSTALACPQVRSSEDYYVYQIGQKINLKFSVEGGIPPYTWSYMLMPQDIDGDKSGFVSGLFYQEGYYSFGVSCSDSKGKSSDSFFTLNIQPSSNIRNDWYSKKIVSVPNRNSPYKYTLDQIAATQKAILKNQLLASKAVAQAKAQLQGRKKDLFQSESTLKLAQNQVKLHQNLVKSNLLARVKAIKIVDAAQTKLNKYQGYFDIDTSYLKQMIARNLDAEAIYKAACALFEKMKALLESTNSLFITAQNQSQEAAHKVTITKILIDDAKNSINGTFDGISLAKQLLQKSRNEQQTATFKVNNIQNEKDMAEFESDQINAAFNSAISTGQQALKSLKAANQNVKDLRDQLNLASNSLGEAKFNLNQALNNLYMAQAAKEQADKAMSIASITESASISGSTTYIFGGCQAGNYPTVFGSVVVKNVNKTSIDLQSGKKMLFGNCSQTIECKAGDIVNYDGYLRDGIIHAVRIFK